MNLAILGTDSNVLRLVAAALEGGHTIEWIGDVRAADASELARLAPHARHDAAEWEIVLDRGTADAVIVGRGEASAELRAEQLKRLASEAMPMLVVHPGTQSVLPYYEVDMARREMGGLVRHYNPVAGHPIFAQLASWVRDGHPEIGPIHQVTCERRVEDSSRDGVIACLAKDVEPLAVIAGDIRRVSAIGPKMNQASFASLQVQMTCSGPASVRWSIGSPAGGNCDVAIGLIGERGTVTLFASEGSGAKDSGEWQLEVASAGNRELRPVEPFGSARTAIQELDRAVHETNGEQRMAMSTWSAATRAMEVVDAVELSLEKGRTLDVHQQELTERLAFRGTMSALGCGLLLLGFFVFVSVSLFGAAEGKDRPLLFASWPILLLALLAAFLLLQFAPLLVVKKSRSPTANESTTDSV